jgi:DNA-binding NtrC family response regulator
LGPVPTGAALQVSEPVVAAPPEPAANGAAAASGNKTLPEAIAELEARAIRDALAATGGNKLAASRLLGISRATLYEKLPLIEAQT